MKRRVKPYSVEEDIALDTKRIYDSREGGLGCNPDPLRRDMIEFWESRDPGGKRAHGITKIIIYGEMSLTTA